MHEVWLGVVGQVCQQVNDLLAMQEKAEGGAGFGCLADFNLSVANGFAVAYEGLFAPPPL
jgi:hypothetical protein